MVVNDSASNKFGHYLGEILRAEGLDAFEVIQLNALTAADLTNHDLTILAETSLTGDQPAMFSDYVSTGGRLLAMRPDGQIASLFGLGAAAGSLSNGYVKINNSATINGEMPGQGLTSATLQIHGTTDRYTPAAGSVVLAQLYSNATTATVYPAVISNQTGRAIAFTYDLAQNVVYTRQGNPANGNVDTDADRVLRTIDLFQTSGGGAPWVDRDKIPVPQADEQQRLFARLVKQMVGEVRPLPQLWYFPGSTKTMLILTGDAHANPQSYYQLEIDSLNAHGGKATFYLTTNGGILTDTTTLQTWQSQGHSFGIHPYRNPEGVMSLSALQAGYTSAVSGFDVHYSPPFTTSRTVRNHQVTWQGWTDAADVAVANGMALDANFYHWGPWLKKTDDNTWPHGYITGSGQPMKFIRADGTILPYYQQLTQLVDEQLFNLGPDYTWNEQLSGTQAITVSRQMIDASQAGDYAALMTQFHVDYYNFGTPQVWAEGTLDYAISLGIPIWNADQWLTFTETRHDADYGNIAWNDLTKTLTFNLTATSTTGISLTTILPLTYRGNNLQSVMIDSLPASYSTQTIKGVDVALVSILAGNHSFVAQYHDNTPPSVSVNDVSVNEGNVGPTAAVFTATLTAVSAQTVTVSYGTEDGSALASTDYVTASGVLTFGPGVLSRAITVTVQGDVLDEPDETFRVNLSSPVNATIGDGQGLGTIIDDDAGPSLSLNDVSVNEGNVGTVSAVFSVTLTAVSAQTVTVSYGTQDGSALASADYITASGVLTFAPGVLSRAITVTVQGDGLDEPDETFRVNLSSPVNGTIGDGQGLGTIIDDDIPVPPPGRKVFLPIVVK